MATPTRTRACANLVDDNCSGIADEGCLCTGCGCTGVSRTAPALILDVTDRTAAGYRFGWATSDEMGNARVDVSCASEGTVHANNRTLSTSYGAPLIVGENNHEVYIRQIAVGCCGMRIEVFIARL